MMEGFPFAKTHCEGKLPIRSAVCTFSPHRSLRHCLDKARLRAKSLSGRLMAGGSIIAEVGRVRSLGF